MLVSQPMLVQLPLHDALLTSRLPADDHSKNSQEAGIDPLARIHLQADLVKHPLSTHRL